MGICRIVEYCYYYNVNYYCIGFLIFIYIGIYFDEFFIIKNWRVIFCEDNLGFFF